MGAMCASESTEAKEARKKSDEIDHGLMKQKKLEEKDIKILLLGTGESGKSTFFKQMKILSSNQRFTSEQMKEYIPAIQSNIITQMRVLLNALSWLQLTVDARNGEVAQRVMTISDWSPELGRDIQQLWADRGIQAAFDQRSRFQLNDSAKYFFDNIGRYFDSDFTPSIDDILRVRVRSTGIEEAQFEFSNINFRMIDVGGQRSERRKWIHCFDCVTAIIFFSSLSEYDQKLREDETQNRMVESLTLFGGVCGIEYFEALPFILFLNKLDLFEEKILRVDPRVCFPEYTGGCDKTKAIDFIKSKFVATVNNTHPLYVHCTIAIDTKNVEFVFGSVRETLLKEALGALF